MNKCLCILLLKVWLFPWDKFQEYNFCSKAFAQLSFWYIWPSVLQRFCFISFYWKAENRMFRVCAQCVIYSHFMHEGKTSVKYFWVISVTANSTFSTFSISVLTHFWYSVFIFGVLKHVVDYPASSSITEEGVLIVYYEAVKIRASILVFRAEHRSQQQ